MQLRCGTRDADPAPHRNKQQRKARWGRRSGVSQHWDETAQGHPLGPAWPASPRAWSLHLDTWTPGPQAVGPGSLRFRKLPAQATPERFPTRGLQDSVSVFRIIEVIKTRDKKSPEASTGTQQGADYCVAWGLEG